jgi:ubiquinone/menaquinone biosynthesis C-methylase UbiE
VGPIHVASSVGFSQQNNALYDAGRPAYSDDTVDFLLNNTVFGPLLKEIENSQQNAAASSAATTVAASSTPAAAAAPSPRVIRLLDLGAGTGIFTRCLWSRVRSFASAHADALQRLGGVEFDVFAVEPVEGMRQRFREKCPKELTAQEGSGASMPGVATGSVNVVFAAQSFHWFSTPESLREIARVLRKDRHSFFCPVWNTRDESAANGFTAALEAIITPCYPADVPRQQSKKWKQVFELPLQGLIATDAEAAAVESSAEGLRPFVLQTSSHHQDPAVSQRGDADLVLARVLSISVIAALPKPEQDAIADRVRTLLREHPDTKGKEQFEIPYVADAYVYRRVAGPV